MEILRNNITSIIYQVRSDTDAVHNVSATVRTTPKMRQKLPSLYIEQYTSR